MKTPRKFFVWVLLSLIPLAVFGHLAFDRSPAVQLRWTLSRQDIDRAKELLTVNNPETSQEGTITTITLSEKELNVAVDYLLNRYVNSASQVSIREHRLALTTTVSTPGNPFGDYLNVSLRIDNRSASPQISGLRIGRVPIPDVVGGWVVAHLIEHSPLGQYYVFARHHVKTLRFRDNYLVVTYRWNNEAYAHARKFLTANADESLLAVYRNKLTEITAASHNGSKLALISVLNPLFDLAYARSGAGSAVAENHALLVALGDYVNTPTMLRTEHPVHSTTKKHPQPTIRLHRRQDIAEHFVASAVLTATGNGRLAGIIGITKEIGDAEHGSGFSFIDLAADRAGFAFGKMAVGSEAQARRLQQIIARAENEHVFMPDVRDLPEYIPNQKFAEEYGGIDGPGYRRIIEQIDARISHCPLYSG